MITLANVHINWYNTKAKHFRIIASNDGIYRLQERAISLGSWIVWETVESPSRWLGPVNFDSVEAVRTIIKAHLDEIQTSKIEREQRRKRKWSVVK